MENGISHTQVKSERSRILRSGIEKEAKEKKVKTKQCRVFPIFDRNLSLTVSFAMSFLKVQSCILVLLVGSVRSITVLQALKSQSATFMGLK